MSDFHYVILPTGVTETIICEDSARAHRVTCPPDAQYHAFSTFGVRMSRDLPRERRHHEMIATMVSLTNRCR